MQFSFSLSLRVFMNVSPSGPNQFIIIGVFTSLGAVAVSEENNFYFSFKVTKF